MMLFDNVALGLGLGYLADAIIGDPRKWHPVAGFGRLAAFVERRVFKPTRMRGVLAELLLVGGATMLGWGLSRAGGAIGLVLVTAATWAVLGGCSLRMEARAMATLLDAGDLPGARLRIRNLVGRDPANLDAQELARACIESVAENGADAVVGPLFWGALLGLPGLFLYRATNTLDAMFGHRTTRLLEFGWVAARFDDLLNWIPARLTVAITALATGSRKGLLRVFTTVRRDAPAHPSPNAGPVEAAFAAALDRQLGGRNVYAGELEERGLLGSGPPVQVTDIPNAVRLQRRIGVLALASAIALRLALSAVR
ncbi:MAG: adenosylcobinamide-phosphate synthase CbiB [Candidatus Nanopelagicales bacterium]